LEMIPERKWGQTPSFGPRQWLRHKLLLKELSKRLPQGLILDAGCGQGRLAFLLSKKGYMVFGFDESRESLNQASQTSVLADPRVRPPAYLQSKMDQIPFLDNSFDAVISGDVLEHLADDKSAVKELFRILKPDGIAIVSVPSDPNKWSVDDEWSGHKRRYNKTEIENLFLNTGFEKLSIYHWGWPIIYIYYRLYYIPSIKNKLNQNPSSSEPAGIKENRLINALFSLLLLPDLLFPGAPWGIGLIAVFRKPPQ